MIKHPVKIFLASSILSLFLFFSPPLLSAAPTVSLSLDRNTILVNKTFSLELTSSWEGEADEYILAPPQLKLPEGIVEKGSSFSTETKEKYYALHYRYTLVAQKAGDYELTPIEISYWKKGNDKEEKVKTEALHLKVTTFFSFLTLGTYRLAGAIIIIFLSLLGILIVSYRIKSKTGEHQKPADTNVTKEMVMSELEQCNAYRIKGDWKDYLKKAIALRNKLSLPEDAVKTMDDLDSLLEQVSYGGFHPTTEEINLIQRQLERALKSAFPDAKDKELEGI